jgi:hypothetical protein
MTGRDIAAKRREIERRYARKFRQQPLPERLKAMGHAEIRRLARYRLGSAATRADVEQHIASRLGPDWQTCPGHELANRALALRVTLEERMHLDLRRFPAWDVSRDQQRWAYRVQRREKDRRRSKSRRKSRLKTGDAKMRSADLIERRESLFYIAKLTGKWLDVHALAKAVQDFDAWRCPDGSRMKPQSLERVIRTELDSLAADGLIKQKIRHRKSGVKRVIKAADARMRGWKRVRTKNDPHGMGTSRISAAAKTRVRTRSYLRARTRASDNKRTAEREQASRPADTLYPPSDTKH